MPKSQIHTELVNQYFAARSDQVYAVSDLEHLFIEKHDEWNLPPSMTSYTFLQMLLTRTHLSQLRLRSRHYSSPILYSWEGKASPMSVALRIKKDSAFFSHESAMWIHGLNENHNNIFINNEQSPTLINGKHSGRLEVQQSQAPSGHPVDVTSLERTLVDITVRPGYSGGVPAVLQAFRSARGRISVTKLLGVLRKLDYTYPYHQSIGFYLERTGYSQADQTLAKDLGAKFDFYLSHGLRNPAFDPNWRVFFPKRLK